MVTPPSRNRSIIAAGNWPNGKKVIPTGTNCESELLHPAASHRCDPRGQAARPGVTDSGAWTERRMGSMDDWAPWGRAWAGSMTFIVVYRVAFDSIFSGK